MIGENDEPARELRHIAPGDIWKPAPPLPVPTAMRNALRWMLLTSLMLLAVAAAAQKKVDEALFAEIEKQDRAMFDAYNAHDVEKLMTYFDKGLEFYHDQGGLQSYDDVVNGMTQIFRRNDGIRRELVPGTLEIHPLGTYGAIEIGAHRFCHKENGQDDCGTFKFLNVWQKQKDGWKITRLVSYDH